MSVVSLDLGVISMRITMSKKQLSALFLCSLAPPSIGYALVPLLPVYVTRHLEGTPAVAGYLMAFIFFSQTLGSTAGGVLSDKLNRRKPVIIAVGMGNIPVIWLMGRVTTIWQLAILAGTIWFLNNIAVVLLGIITGLFAELTERGKIFGILSLTEGIVAILGGLTYGRIVDLFGFPTLFTILALLELFLPVPALFLRDKSIRIEITRENPTKREVKGRPRLGKAFFLLLSAQLLSGVALFVGSLGRSLAMTELGFNAAAISLTVAVGGLVSLPLRPLLGWLSDRTSRSFILASFYLVTTLGLVVLAAAVSLLQFSLAIAFLYIAIIRSSVGAALVTDLSSRESLGTGIALFNAVGRAGGIIGYAITGYAIQQFGMATTFFGIAILPLIAMFLLIPVHRRATLKTS